LSTASTAPVTVNYSTEKNTGGPAKANTDYVPVTSSVVFAPGETSKTVSVEVVGDTAYEANEYFYLSLTSAMGADIVINGAEGYRNNWVMATIKNDDVLGSANQISGIVGTTNKDVLGGTAGNDLIDGRGGSDILTGYAGNDTFLFASAYANKDLNLAARIIDFKHGFDHIALQANLDFENIQLSQGTGANTENTLISLQSGDVLAVLIGVNSSTLGASDFIHIV
jgi:Ca2+-binding RTX toxin-like protein